MDGLDSVLCAVDASGVASRVVRHAVGMAALFHAKLRVLTVTSGHVAAAESAVRDQLRDALPPGARYLPEVDVRVVKLALGQVVDSILLAANEGADLIVAGTHSKSGLSRWLLGSTSAALLAETPCPAMLVPPGTLEIIELDIDRAALRPGAVLVAVDLAERNDRQLTLAAQCAARAGQPLIAMTVAASGTDPQVAHEALAARLTQAGHADVRIVVRQGANVADEIDRVAVTEHAGLVVMGLRERGARGEVATAVLSTKDAVVLAVPASRR